MNDDLRRLLGGYATNTLTEAEREELFRAALEDEQLFEALADEEALRDLLEDANARAELLRATEAPRFTVAGAFREWFERPRSKVLVALGTVAFAGIGIRALYEYQPSRTKQAPAEITAELRRVPPMPQTSAAVEGERTPQPGSGPQRLARRAKESKPAPEARAANTFADQAEAVTITSAAAAPALPPAEKVEVAEDKTTRVAKSGALELKYAVLLKQADGTFLPVSPDHVFKAGDVTKLWVQGNQRGLLVVKTAPHAAGVFSTTIQPGLPVMAGQEVAITEAGVSPTFEVAYSPMPSMQLLGVRGAEPAPMSYAAPTPPPSQQRKVAADQSRDAALSQAVATGASTEATPPPPPPGLQFRIVLRKQ